MKLFVVLVVFAFLGCALGDEESGDLGTQNEDGDESSPIICPDIPGNDLVRFTAAGYLQMGIDCISIDNTGLESDNLTTLEDFQLQSQKYCLDVPDMNDCLVNASKVSQTCQNQTTNQPFQIYIDMLKDGLEIGCRENGLPIAVIVSGITRLTSPRDNLFGDCLDLIDHKISLAGKPELDSAAKILMFYRHLELAKDCFHGRIQEEQLRNVVDSFIVEIRNRLKCIHPESHSTVLCSTIVNN